MLAFSVLMQLVNGVLVSCDVALKEIYLTLDNELQFIIEDLDEQHLFVQAEKYEYARKRAEAMLLDYTFQDTERL